MGQETPARENLMRVARTGKIPRALFLLEWKTIPGIDRQNEMITQEHLEHWIKEIEYARNGLKTHLLKEGFRGKDGIMVDGSHLSFDYLNEKINTIRGLLNCIEDDIKNDK